MPRLAERIERFRDYLLFELVFTTLAITSVGMLGYEWMFSPDPDLVRRMIRIDMVIATLFLIDFFLGWLIARDNKEYLKHNWYMFFASLPIDEHAVRSLRILRLLRLWRIVGALSRTTYLPGVIPKWIAALKRRRQ